MSTLTNESQRARHATFVAGLEKKQEFQILDTLAREPHATPQDTVQQIEKLTLSSVKDRVVLSAHVYDTACCTLEVASRTASNQQPKLVTFVQQLQRITITDQAVGKPLTQDGDLVWTELPTFGFTFADELGSFNPLASDVTAEEKRRWENAMAFVAQLTAVCDQTDFSIWALTAFSYAFGPWNSPTTPTDVAIRVACQWFIYAGDKLWANVKNGRRFGSGDVKEPPDFNRAVWDSWKRSLHDAQSNFADEQTQKMLHDALVEMGRLERES